MASVAAITELEAELSQARNAAEALLAQLAAMTEAEDLIAYDDLPPHLVARARGDIGEVSRSACTCLVLVRQSNMLGSTDQDAIRLAVHRIDAALRLRQHEEWGPEILNNEEFVLGVRPAGYSEDRRLQPGKALTEIDEAVDQVLRRVGCCALRPRQR